MSVQLFKGDLTTLDVDAIVNAANTSLLGGGGVDGAIHRAAGPDLLAFNKTLGGCATGEAKLSPGFNLKAKHVISTVGPIWQGGNCQEPAQLKKCYENSLKLAVEQGFNSIAFPSISTGAYGYPLKKAATLAVSTVQNFLLCHANLQVTFVCYDDDTHRLYETLLATHLRAMTLQDYEEVYGLWTETAGMGMRSLDDSEAGIAKFLNRNPNTNFVAVQDNCLVGVILTGHDGRRGYIYHAAVKAHLRGAGIGKRLLEAALQALKNEGIHKAALVVFSNNSVGNSFWEREGFATREDLVYRNKSLNDENK